jgi:hypothetical protein
VQCGTTFQVPGGVRESKKTSLNRSGSPLAAAGRPRDRPLNQFKLPTPTHPSSVASCGESFDRAELAELPTASSSAPTARPTPPSWRRFAAVTHDTQRKRKRKKKSSTGPIAVAIVVCALAAVVAFVLLRQPARPVVDWEAQNYPKTARHEAAADGLAARTNQRGVRAV